MAGNVGGYASPSTAARPAASVASGALTSGGLAPNSVVSGTVASGAVMGQAGGGPYNIASGTITTNDLGSGAITSGNMASGSIGSFALASGAVTSGRLLSGNVSTYDLASGCTVARAQFVAPIYSGTSWGLVTEENISGVRGVCISQSGNLRVAMASVSGRMPAIGVVIDNVLSGIQANVYTDGLVFFTSGLFTGVNHFGQPVWLGRSGQLSPISGSFDSGGYASGDIGQKLGVAAIQSGNATFGSGAVLLRVDLVNWSGGPLGEATGGVI